MAVIEGQQQLTNDTPKDQKQAEEARKKARGIRR